VALTGTAAGTEPRLAAVVIGRNEGRWIDSTLRSVLAAVEPFAGAEVVMVDSCSTDETCERAAALPIRLVELRPDAPLSPALGRLVGQQITRSRYILFVDGDTEISAAWVREALAYLDGHPRVAAVDGKLPELYYEGTEIVGGSPDCFGAGDVPAAVEGLGGNAIYRRDILERVGSFNPYVVSYEEAELAARLRRAGSSVVRLPVVMGTHRTGLRGSLKELGRRYRDNLIKGYGQVLRLALRQGTFREHARSMKRYLQFQAVLACALIAGLASLVTGDPRIVLVPLVGALALVGAFMVRSRSLTKPFQLIADWGVWTVPMIRGFLERPRDPRALRAADMIGRMRDLRAESADRAPALARPA
jgi:glycosyltransferase involved in cell wall biosynthesis